MSAITADFTKSADLTNLREQIDQDIKPWEKIADKIRFQALFVECCVTDVAPPDIDFFDLLKKEKALLVYCRQSSNTDVTFLTKDFADNLRILTELAQKFVSSVTDPDNKAIFELTVSILNKEKTLKIFEYSKK